MHATGAAAMGGKRSSTVFAVVALAATISIAGLRTGSVEHVYCEGPLESLLPPAGGDQTPAAAPRVVMLGAAWCNTCKQAARFFVENSVAYCEYDIEDGAEGSRAAQRLRVDTVPVILVGRRAMRGFDQRRMKSMLEDAGLIGAG